jgi:flagellar protein FlaC
MGKVEEESSEEESDEDSNSDTETEEKEVAEESEEKEESKQEQKEEKSEESQEKKKDVNELRKVIKVNQDEKGAEKKEPKKTQEDEGEVSTRDSLEQKRAILQSIKDFDFQIKKNSEDINSIHKNLDSVTKDLDDLVSLYEIVSEQMNPFVGLSKVTKKRIEALENFTKEVEDLKNRMNDIEAFAESAGGNIQKLKEIRGSIAKNIEKTDQNKNVEPDITQSKNDLSFNDLDYIIEKSLSDLDLYKNIDYVIDEYIENLFT